MSRGDRSAPPWLRRRKNGSGIGALEFGEEAFAIVIEHGAMRGIEREVFEFVRIGFEIVEFLDFIWDERVHILVFALPEELPPGDIELGVDLLAAAVLGLCIAESQADVFHHHGAVREGGGIAQRAEIMAGGSCAAA